MKSTVLCYNLKGTKKGRKIAMIFGYLGYRVRFVEETEYRLPVGVLAGIKEMEEKDAEKETAENTEVFSEEMLLIHCATEELLDKAIFLMRKEKVQVGLKAILTPTNQEWTSVELHDEILKEHLYMNGQAKEHKEKE